MSATSSTVARFADRSASTAAVASTGEPAGRSTMTWNSLLLSNGSIFSTTSWTAASDTDSRIATTMPMPSASRRRPPRTGSTNGDSSRVNADSSRRSSAPGPWATACFGASLSASQGVITNAIASEISMPMLALIGIGLMYGPISPVTKAIGSSAAMTVKVARIVGPPTSSTAAGISAASGASG